jgi:hypothetical protein
MNNQDLHDEKDDHEDDHSFDAMRSKEKHHQKRREDRGRASQCVAQANGAHTASVGNNSGM